MDRERLEKLKQKAAKERQEKMSKIDLSSFLILMQDEEVEVNTNRRRLSALCKGLKANPVWNTRAQQEERTFIEFEELSVAYAKGEVHPGDVKPSLAKASNRILELKKEVSELTLQRDLAQSQVKDLVQVLGDDKLSPFFQCDLHGYIIQKQIDLSKAH
ncbi:hypothetical protein ACLB2K_011925 [Fragaria x ananassa]